MPIRPFFKNYGLFLLCLATGLVLIFSTRHLAEGFTFSNGKQLLAFYFPLPVACAFLLVNAWRKRIDLQTAWQTIILFLLLLLPLIPFFSDRYQHELRDDAFRYQVMATNMVKQGTLWGGDDLLYNTDLKVYLFQPGYRYYLAAWIKILGNEQRVFQFFNMLVYLSCMTWLVFALGKLLLASYAEKGILLFLLLSSPFAVKLVLLGMSEWLLVSIFFMMAASYLQNRRILTIVLLALLPFIRQNVLIASVIILIWLLIQWRRWGMYLPVYIAIVLLPVYHNLYYAGTFKFLATYIDSRGYMSLYFEGSVGVRTVKTILYKIGLYGGVDWLMKNFWANALALSFIPLGTVTYFLCIWLLQQKDKWIFLAVTLSIILPTLILGGRAYYPRFEWVNLALSFAFFCMLQNKLKKTRQA